MPASTLRVAVLRRLYRIAWRGLQLRAMVWRRSGSGVKCVLTHGEEVLLVRHTYGRREVWYLPGGRVRRGEPPLHAAAREMREELGLDDLQLSELATFETRLERIDLRLTCLHAAVSDPTAIRLEPGEIAAVGWFDRSLLPSPLGCEEGYLIGLLDRDARRCAQPPERGSSERA